MTNNRIYSQYRNKPKAVDFFNITVNMKEQFDDVFSIIRKMYDIETMIGAQLDIIGDIVVLGRTFEDDVSYNDYVCGQDGAECGKSDVQFSPLDGNIDSNVSDDIYRVLLRDKIQKNNINATYEEILDSLMLISPDNDVYIIDNEDLTFSVVFNKPLTQDQKFILDTFDVVPRPQGINYTGYTGYTI